MRIFQVVIGVLFGVAVFLSLDYILPSRNTVRITNVYNQLIDLNGTNAIFYASPDTGAVETSDGRRDVRFIAAVRPNGKPFVYRNEDTGLIWPPYFKYDSANLHAVASDQVSTAESPKWVSVSAYGWRIPWWSVYPNAIGIRPVAGPDVQPMNWPAMLILGIIGVLLAVVWRAWNRFIDRREGRLVRVEQRVPAAKGGGVSRIRRWWAARR
ncbi:DUF1523 family protein [Paracoccus sp. Z118]|uniref:DUF1523 family protein n=1 Tax=Paracoccus sp. Z118 TaxID=2851017 RepID=UPI001C2C0EB5|nr:DUF1523 family protein [Paracoccus sp. Z118]MBV0890534.1 DUF1523 family protein [Paracoccus sp. Z118]